MPRGDAINPWMVVAIILFVILLLVLSGSLR
jgi:hypothetical protein